MAWILLHALFLGVAMADELTIHEDLSPLSALRPVRDETLLLILHTTEGGDESGLRLVRRRGLAHFVVQRDGRVVRTVEEEREARHAGLSMWNATERLDEVSLGVEVVGHHDRPITRAQEASLAQLIATLQERYGLADDAVLPHAMVAYGRPNRWHRQNHRGRKRCGMQFAGVDLRKRLGLTSRPATDPDVDAGRLIEADSELVGVLFGHRIAPGQTAAEIAGDAYRSRTTIYVLPGGKRLRGTDVRDWATIPAGTWVLLDR